LLLGELTPREAAGSIYTLFLPRYPVDVDPFLLLHDEYSLGDHTTRSDAQIDAAVVEAAREFLSERRTVATREEMWARWRPGG
jgi:hypothetical protein